MLKKNQRPMWSRLVFTLGMLAMLKANNEQNSIQHYKQISYLPKNAPLISILKDYCIKLTKHPNFKP